VTQASPGSGGRRGGSFFAILRVLVYSGSSGFSLGCHVLS
jgi:hypothetical protein